MYLFHHKYCLSFLSLYLASYSVPPEASSLLGLSRISVNSSMTVNDTSLTNATGLTNDTTSRLEAKDPLDTLDLATCLTNDVLDGCKVT